MVEWFQELAAWCFDSVTQFHQIFDEFTKKTCVPIEKNLGRHKEIPQICEKTEMC